MHRDWTEQQTAVLQGSGKMVVSASAGSGKTAVMIEKITRLIVQGAKVEEILAMTFTRSSAKEMKERLQKCLQQVAMQTEDVAVQQHVQAQLEEIDGASITTIDSFCNTLIQKNFFRLEGVDPNFSILTEENDWLQKLQNRAMHAALQEWLKDREEQKNIADFCKIFAKNGSFEQLQEMVLQAYNKVRNRENFIAFIADMPKQYTPQQFENLLERHFHSCKNKLHFLMTHLDKLYLTFCQYKSTLSDKFFDYIVELTNFCKSGSAFTNYTALAGFANEVQFSKKPAYRAAKKTPEHIVEGIQAADNILKQIANEVKECRQQILFYQDLDRARQNFYQSGQLTEAFCRLILLFDRFFTEQKRQLSKLEFIDLPHLSNQLLQNEELQQELREQYKYLFVDEYQDTSPIQESILQKLNIQNFCMVGDLKQSIYGFRGCTPEIMQDKMLNNEQYALYQLSQNFRSRKSIIDFVNTVFDKINMPFYEPMHSNIERHCQEGVYSYSYMPKEREGEACTKVYSVLDNLLPKIEITPEAELVYGIICNYIERMQADKKERQDCYKDIVLLTRNRDSNIEKIIDFLATKGVPITTDAEVDICLYPEIKELCNILQFIDNRQQDIPLVATLKSALIGMTDEELIAIKQSANCQNGKDKTFYIACQNYLATFNDSIAQKLYQLQVLADKLQAMATIKSCSEILEYLLIDRELELALLASGGKNSEKYATNRQKLLRIARLLEASADCTVSEFVQKLRLQQGKILYKQSGGQDAVQIMTVHQSKGLEFPVVILVGLESALARNEKIDKFKFNANFGFYFDAYDTQNFTKEKTILSRLAREEGVAKAIEDQKRIFYVAMTRAKNEMHILLNKKREEKNQLKAFANFREFLMQSNIDVYDKTAELIVAMGTDFLKEQTGEQEQRLLPLVEMTKEEIEQFKKSYQKVYPYAGACMLPIKSSATALKAIATINTTNAAAESVDSREKRLFTTGENVITGLAYHAFLEHVNFFVAEQALEAEVQRVYASLQAEYQAVLDKGQMLKILNLPIFKSLQPSATIYREKSFLLQTAAKNITILNTDVDDCLLLQGIIDLLIVQENEIKIVDYKYSSHTIEALSKEYMHQMQIYKLAVQNWQPNKVVHCYLLNIKSGAFTKVDI